MAPVNQSLEIELITKSRWSVRLGADEWAKHTYERSANDPLALLGSARHEMQSGALTKLGCEFAQGYGIARPMPPSDMPAWVTAWQSEAALQSLTER